MTESTLLQNIPDEKQKELIRKSSHSIDSRWQYATFMELGVELGNKLNKKVVNGFAQSQMYRLLNMLEINTIHDIDEFLQLMLATMEIFWKREDFHHDFEIIDDNTLHAIVTECPTNNNIRKMKIESLYDCACFSMRQGWYEVMGLEVEETCLSCLKAGEKTCTIEIKIKEWPQ